jgi:hypothetical protein
VREVTLAVLAIVSSAAVKEDVGMPECIEEVLQEWGCTWMWKSLRMQGYEGWMKDAISDGTLVAVTDGSYIRERFPELCSAAFILECSSGRGRIIGSFAESSPGANAYRGELLGLMAIHLMLLAADKVWSNLGGRVAIYSDCLGALARVANLPPHRIPTQCRHSDVLKNILVNCTSLSFTLKYAHVKAHQDDKEEYENLTRPAQLNVHCDGMAKNEIWGFSGKEMPRQRCFPLEPISVWVGKDKMTSDTSKALRFWVHKQLAEQTLCSLGLLTPTQFGEVAWKQIYDALHEVPRMFQIWAAKQVTEIAGVNANQAARNPGKDMDPRCPSCSAGEDSPRETCSHVLYCEEEGRVAALNCTIDLMNTWLRKVGTQENLRKVLVEYARSRGATTMESVVWNKGARFQKLGKSMDVIGWRRFMEGMVSREAVQIQSDWADIGGSPLSTEDWTKGLTVKLLEVTHGQWLYRNIQVHDAVCGSEAAQRKEELQQLIEEQIDKGGEGLDEQDRHLLDINLEDLETSSGEDQYYWLVAIQAAREHRVITQGRRDARENNQRRGRRA